MSLETPFAELLRDAQNFHTSLQQYVEGKRVDDQNNDSMQSVSKLLLMIEFVFEMLRDVGLAVQHQLYVALKEKNDPRFEHAAGWRKCALSGLQSCRCLCVNALTVDEQYIKWLRCIWLVTHIQELEHHRRRQTGREEMLSEHTEMYRTALAFVFEQLQNLYAAVCTAKMRMQLVKN